MADPLDILTGRVGQRSSDDGWSNTLANIAQVVASIPENRRRAIERSAVMEAQAENAQIRRDELRLRQQGLQQQQDAKAKAAEMDQAVGAIMQGAMVDGPSGGKVLDRKRFVDGATKAGVAPERLASFLATFDKIDESVGKSEKERLGHVADVIDGVLEHGADENAVTLGIAVGKANGWIRDNELAPIMDAMASGKDIKPILSQIRDSIRGPKEKPKPVAVAPGGTLVNPETGAEIFKAPAKPENAPNVGSFEDYVVRKFGTAPTPDQIKQARKEYNQADDRPAINVRMPNGMTPGQAFQATRQLRNDYERETKSAKTVNQQLAQMKSSLQAVKNGSSPAGSQGVLVTFQKILDPTSVVRESEYARSASGLSLLGRIEGAWDKIKSGGAGVSVGDLEQFVNLAEQFAKSQNAFAQQSKQQIDAVAKEYGLKPENITKDYADATAEHHTFSVAEVQDLAKQSGATYAEVKAALERKGHVVK